jgi:hypothetical protein
MIGYEHLLSLMTKTTSSSNHANNAIFPQSTALTVSVPTSTSQPYLTPTPFIAGCLARTVSATVISPLELFRTRLQALPGPGEERPTYRNTAESIGKLMKQQGVKSLWRGLGPTLWRDVPFSGQYCKCSGKPTVSRQDANLLVIRHLLGGFRIHKEIPYRIANAASRPRNDFYFRRHQRNCCVGANSAIRRAQDSTPSLHARSHLFATSTQSSCKHTAAAGTCDEDGGMESAVCWCDPADCKGRSCVWHDDWML